VKTGLILNTPNEPTGRLKKYAARLVNFWRGCGSKAGSVALIDAVLLCVAVYVSYALRFSIFLGESVNYGFAPVLFVYITGVLLSFALFGVYRVYWLQTSLEELILLLKAYLLPCAFFTAVYCLFDVPFVVPRSVIGMLLLGGFALLASVRVSWRLTSLAAAAPRPRRALIVGAGEAGVTLARDLRRNKSDLEIVGFLDDDAAKNGKMIAGFPVLGGLEKIAEIVRERRVSDVLVALPSAPAARVRHILNQAVPMGVNLRMLPSLRELAGGLVTTNTLRPVKLEDLLQRDPVSLDSDRIGALLGGKVVLITGAGGTIGSEIVRQILHYRPLRLVLLGHGEFSIYSLLEELLSREIESELVPVIADVADRETLAAVMQKWRPSVIFHAAAHKHVPLMESNAHEAIRVNCLGTWNIADLAGELGVERFVMISTDKAVNPSSVMGASKRIAEMSVMELAGKYPSTAYMAVRFGNVLGSRGSVVPKFERQIAAGGPVTVTHPKMLRYFMLVPEAAGLVLQTAAIGTSGKIYVLDMGEPVSILHVAETLIRLNGYEPGRDIEIRFTGIRPGEKLFEELFYDPSHVDCTEHRKIFSAHISEVPSADMFARIKGLLNGNCTPEDISAVVPEYQPL
jgi:FlaA1/EpsC-like NDP-sugar epimerase